MGFFRPQIEAKRSDGSIAVSLRERDVRRAVRGSGTEYDLPSDEARVEGQTVHGLRQEVLNIAALLSEQPELEDESASGVHELASRFHLLLTTGQKDFTPEQRRFYGVETSIEAGYAVSRD